MKTQEWKLATEEQKAGVKMQERNYWEESARMENAGARVMEWKAKSV